VSIADDFTTIRRFITATLQAPGSGVVEVEPGEVAGAFTDCLDRIEAALRCAEADLDAVQVQCNTLRATTDRLLLTNQILGESPTVPALLDLIRRLKADMDALQESYRLAREHRDAVVAERDALRQAFDDPGGLRLDQLELVRKIQETPRP
jgi:hypothetical protein